MTALASPFGPIKVAAVLVGTDVTMFYGAIFEKVPILKILKFLPTYLGI